MGLTFKTPFPLSRARPQGRVTGKSEFGVFMEDAGQGGTVLWNEAEGVSVNTRAKITRREREDQSKVERKADRNALVEEVRRFEAQKRKLFG